MAQNEIYREIWLTENRRVEPIAVSENSKIPIKIRVMDITITGSTARAYAYNGRTGAYTANVTNPTVASNVVTLIPDNGLFLAGSDRLQIQFPTSGGNYITREFDVVCAPDYSNGGKTPRAEDVKGLTERAESAAKTASDVLASIPEDYSQLSESIVEIIDKVGEKSYNLLPFDYSSKTINGVNVEYSNGTLSINGTATDSGGRTRHIADVSLEAGSYRAYVSNAPLTIFVEKNGTNEILCQFNSAGGSTFILSESDIVYIGIQTLQGTFYNGDANIMITKGTESVDFVPPVNSANDKFARKQIEEILSSVPSISITPTISEGEGYFFTKDGLRNSLNSYCYTDVITIIKGQTIKFRANGETPNVIAMLTRWGEDGEFIENLHTCTSTNYEIVEYTATHNAEILRLCYSKGKFDYCIVSGADVNKIGDIIQPFEEYDVFPFNTIGIIGDSLTNGGCNYLRSDGVYSGMDRPNYSWGKFMERRHGVSVTLFAKGGASTRSWLDSSNNWGITKMQSDSSKDLYIIGLGVNDYYSLGQSYLGSVNDIVTDDSLSQNDTYYGNYSKIICLLKQKTPRCKIFCLTNPSMPDLIPPVMAKRYNKAIRDIVSAFDENVYLLDLESDLYYLSPQANNLWYRAHSTAMGYANMAEHLWRIMNRYVRDNFEEFLDVQWIQENHD